MLPPPDRRELRAFALTVGLALAALAAVQQWRGRPRLALALAAPAALLLVVGLLTPLALRPVHAAWMALAHAMSRVTTPLVLGVVYFLVLTPLGLVMRAVGRSPLRRRRDAATYFEARPPGARRSDLRRQF